MTKGQEALSKLINIFADYIVISQNQEQNAQNKQIVFEYLCRSNEYKNIEKELKALETLKKNIKVKIDYGTNRDISVALVFYIDSQQKIYVVDEAIRETNPEHFEELENLKEVLE